MLINRIFYNLKPFIPRTIQLALRRQLVLYKRKHCSHIWPIDPNAGKAPDKWSGWPDRKRFALVLSHDVDLQHGHDKCRLLMDLEESLGFKSSFNFVAERYIVSQSLRDEIISRGFEISVHGLKHDGKLFKSKKIFNKRAERINHYLQEWKAKGFTSPSTHHNLNWMHALNIEYDISTFDTDPFEPQPDAVSTIFPFWVQNNSSENGFVELPYTLPQDFSLFIIMMERNINIWKKKLDWIAAKGGMALLNTHPDYMSFDNNCFIETYPSDYYKEFLLYVKNKYRNQYWHTLPGDIARFVHVP
ncbi:MAG: hypothetical protein ACT6FB_00365 [Methanosarcinaceae archaeon]